MPTYAELAEQGLYTSHTGLDSYYDSTAASPTESSSSGSYPAPPPPTLTPTAPAPAPAPAPEPAPSPYADNPLVSGGHVTEEAMAAYYEKYGTAPVWRYDPAGNPYVTRSGAADILGIDQGSMLSTAGTGTGAGSVYLPQELADATSGMDHLQRSAQVADYYQNLGLTDIASGSYDPTAPLTSENLFSETPINVPGLGEIYPAIPGGENLLLQADLESQRSGSNEYQQFLDWFRGEGGLAEGNLGDFYGIPEGRSYETPYGSQTYYPGQFGTSFNTEFMEQFPQLGAANLQIQRMQDGLEQWGPYSPFVPPRAFELWGDGSTPSFYQGGGEIWGGSGSGGGFGGVGEPGGEVPWNPNDPGGGAGGGTGLPGPGGVVGDPGPPPPGPYWPADQGPYPQIPSPPPGGFPDFPGFPGGGDPGGPGGGPGGGPSSADEFLAYGAGDVGYLRSLIDQQGLPTSSLPAWQAMVDAQERNIDRRRADLNEQFNVSGNRFSTAFGDAAVDFETQSAKDQNALLAQMEMASLEAGRGRQAGAAGQLAGQGYGGASQLSSQNFQALMQQMNQSYGAAQSLFGSGANAAGQLAGAGNQGALALLGGSFQGAEGLFGAENQAAMSEAQRQQFYQQLGLSGAQDLSRLWQSNLLTGSQLGGQQYNIQQDQLSRLYQEFLRTQNYNNPLLGMMFQGATAQPSSYFPQYQANPWGSLAQTGAGGLQGLLAALFSPNNSNTGTGSGPGPGPYGGYG